MPRGRLPAGDHALSGAERQARYRARRQAERASSGQRLAARYLYTIPAHNARFAVKAEREGSAFVAVPGLDPTEVLCVQEERVVGNDNCVSFLKLKLPESPLRPHFVRATVKVHQYPLAGWRSFMAGVASAATTVKAF